ncbi:MAG: hypothetical protein SWQ30_06615 [Thermodesulfobacteriota bacterium]|nr:hypothetical protein [Thermodesulfobacteriota bacterium]
MKLYTPSKIINQFYDHVGRLQIADLVKEGIIKPTQEADRRGEAHLYDKRQVLLIGLAIAMRDILTRNFTRRTIKRVDKYLREMERGKRPKWDIMVIHYSLKKGEAEWLTYSYREMAAKPFREGYDQGKTKFTDPRQYRTVCLNVSDLIKYIDEHE